MKQFYNLFSNEKVVPLAQQLSWSYYVELLPIKDKNKLMYLNISMEQHLSKRELREKLRIRNMKDYLKKTKVKLIKDNKVSQVFDYIKEPILIKNSNNYNIISEKNFTKVNTRRY